MADYKNTINLPKTGFAMKADLANREPGMLAVWDVRTMDPVWRRTSAPAVGEAHLDRTGTTVRAVTDHKLRIWSFDPGSRQLRAAGQVGPESNRPAVGTHPRMVVALDGIRPRPQECAGIEQLSGLSGRSRTLRLLHQ